MPQSMSVVTDAETRSNARDWTGAVRLTFHKGGEVYAEDRNSDLIYRIFRGVVRTAHVQMPGRATACEKVARLLKDMAARSCSEFVILPMIRQDTAAA